MKFFVCTHPNPEMMDEPDYSFEIIEADSAADAAVAFAKIYYRHQQAPAPVVFVSIFDPKRIEIKRNETVTYEAVEKVDAAANNRRT